MMKKVFFLLLLVICAITPVVAGSGSTHSIRVGVGGGLDAGLTTSFNPENLYELESYTGFFLGPQADWRITRHIGVDAGLFWHKNKLSFNGLEDDIAVSSFQIPVNLSVAFLRTSLLSLLLEAGPQFRYNMLDKKQQYADGNITFDDYELSLNLGVAAEVADFIRVGAHINMPTGSFATIKETVTDKDSFRTSTLQITASILF